MRPEFDEFYDEMDDGSDAPDVCPCGEVIDPFTYAENDHGQPICKDCATAPVQHWKTSEHDEARHPWEFGQSTEPVHCREFGCGRQLTPQESLYGNKCIHHSKTEKPCSTLLPM